MPNIAARSNLPAAPAAPAADLSSPASRAGSHRGDRADRGTTFDEVLSGARRRQPAAPTANAEPEPVESKAGAPEEAPRPEEPEPTAKSKPAKSKPRAGAARESDETAETEQTPGEPQAAATTESEAQPADAGDEAETANAGATEGKTPATPRRANADAEAPVNPNLSPAEQLPGGDFVAGSAPETDPPAPGQLDELPADAPAAEGPAKPPPDAAVLDPKDVLGDQPTPVLLGEIAQAQQGQPAAPVIDAPAVDSEAAAAEGSPAALASAVSRVAHGPHSTAATDRATPSPHLDQPVPGGAPFAERSVATPSAGVASNAADVVQSLEPSKDAAAAPDAAPTVATQAAPDLTAAATRALESLAGQHVREAASPTSAVAADAPQLPPEVQFAEDNHSNIVAGVRGQLMPTGGTMQIRLDPPELGPLAVTIRLNDGVMEASFETSNDQAAKLLSHSLSALKTSLEAQGVTVDRLHVQQAPKSEQANQQGGNGDSRDQQQNQNRDPQQDHAARQEHQRKEMLRRMWAKLRGVEDPLDMVA